jgi:hypothetical protein
MLFAVEAHKQISWCKADCSLVMGQVSATLDTESRAGVARFMLFQKGKWKATQFLMEWLTYCVNPLANTFDNSTLVAKEHGMFKEHRAEQAIMTNLAHKYGLELYREADQTGEWSNRHRDLYPQLFSQQDRYCDPKTREIGVGSKFRNIG